MGLGAFRISNRWSPSAGIAVGLALAIVVGLFVVAAMSPYPASPSIATFVALSTIGLLLAASASHRRHCLIGLTCVTTLFAVRPLTFLTGLTETRSETQALLMVMPIAILVGFALIGRGFGSWRKGLATFLLLGVAHAAILASASHPRLTTPPCLPPSLGGACPSESPSRIAARASHFVGLSLMYWPLLTADALRLVWEPPLPASDDFIGTGMRRR